jgi:hypothetical protein
MAAASGAGDDLTKEERAWNAAQSLHGAELEGHAVTAGTQMDTADYVAGEIDSEELLRRVRTRYGVPSEDESGGATVYASVNAAASAYATGLIDGDGFVAAVVGLPVVRQNPMPDHWFDDWARVDGPLSDLQDALSQRRIPAELYDAALIAMANAGHEA